jgi:glutamyl-tRNA synthetase
MRVRFAPSPTGHLHVGGARTAILNWLLARRFEGSFVLRIEDTDAGRNVASAEEQILDDLRWLGLNWDEGPDIGGPYAPYRQSERGSIYADQATQLLANGIAYACTCPPATEAGGDREGPCPCAARGLTEVPAGASIRFRVPHREVSVSDAIRGEIVFPAGSIEDFVLVRGNGRATYNFATVVDDVAMRITHVIRGADHLVNTPKQILVYEAMGAELPVFAHIPLILGADRQKLSKRHGATSVGEHRRLGYMPEALVNYLSLLSWSSPSGEEFLPVDRLIEEVALSRVGASDAIFDPEKLRWLSSRYIQELPPAALLERLRPFVDADRFDIPEERMPAVAEALRKRISLLSEANATLESFLGPLSPERRAAREEMLREGTAEQLLLAIHERLEELPAWTEEAIESAIRDGGKAVGARGKSLFMPLRLALTGAEHGPELGRVASLLGRERTLGLLEAKENV